MKLIQDKVGQDIIEYMLLAAFLSIAGYVGVTYIGEAIQSGYETENRAIQDLWEIQEPVK